MTDARQALDAALAALVAGGGPPPACWADPTLWSSERLTDLNRAAQACAGCPLLDPCAEAGVDEVHGVWGGIVRDRRCAHPVTVTRRSG